MRIKDSSTKMSEKAMAPHSNVLAWKIPWTEEPGGLQSMGLLRVGHNWVTSLSLFTFMHWRRKWQPTPGFLPRESQGWGSWSAAIYGVARSQTQLKRLSSSSSNKKCYFTDTPGGPVVKTLYFHCRGMGSIPGQVTQLPHTVHRGKKIKVNKINI